MDRAVVDAFYASLDEMGEQQVRRILARGAWNPERTRLAEDWLASLEDTREARRSLETLNVAKSARLAAWFAVFLTVITIGLTVASWLLPRG